MHSTISSPLSLKICIVWLKFHLIFRVNLTFWNELAHVAYQHVEPGKQIFVSGRLVSDEVKDNENIREYFKVTIWIHWLSIIFVQSLLLVLCLVVVTLDLGFYGAIYGIKWYFHWGFYPLVYPYRIELLGFNRIS